MLHWLYPKCFWLLGLLPVVGLLDWIWLTWSRRQRDLFADRELQAPLLPRTSRRRLGASLGLWYLAAACLVLALARPQGESVGAAPVKRLAVQVYLVLDNSLSMQARDLGMGRLEAVKREIAALLAALPDDRIGLVIFAGEAKLLCPATVDQRALQDALERAAPGLAGRGGSAPGAGLLLAVEKLKNVPAGAGRVAVIFSDGESNRPEDRLAQAAALAATAGIRVYTVGVGTRDGAPIPMGTDAMGREQFRSYHGQMVRTRLEPFELQKTAKLAGGLYFSLENLGTVAPRLASEIKKQARWVQMPGSVWQYREYFPWLVLLALLCLWLELLLRIQKAEEKGQ